jgi:hypothetical protein
VSFLFPALLGGLAAVSIPIVIHLLNKFRVKNVDWGAMRFLQDSLRKNERKVKIEDLILLILRCLMVVAAVLAFARPVLKALTSAGGDSTGPVAAVVLLDNSASMLQSNGVDTRFDLAKKEIRQWLDQRDPQSLAALYLVSDRTEAVIAKPAPDFALFRKMLEIAQAGERNSNLAQGIRTAYQSLKTIEGRPREIRVYTDAQTAAWSGFEEIRKLASENPDILLKPIIIGAQGEENTGILAVKADGGIPAAKQPCRIRIEVGNYGSKPAEAVRVSLSIDEGQTAGEAVIPSIPAGATQSVNLVINFPSPGPHTVTATIPPDAFSQDNQRTLALDVVSQMSALIVEGSEADSTMDRDGYFLSKALVPLPRDRAAQYYLGLKFAKAGRLAPAALADSEVVFLCNPGTISPENTQNLKDYVQGGGNLVIFPGPQTEPEKWKQNTTWMELLPATLGTLKQASDESKFTAWQAGDFEHPVTALWNDSHQGSLGTVKFSQYFPLTPAKTGNPRVMVRFANGDPSVMEGSYGKGSVVLFSSTSTPEWNNLPLHPSFVPLMQRLMGYLNRKTETRLVLSPGEPFQKKVKAEWRALDFSVQVPGADPTPRSAGQITTDGETPVLRYSATDKPGPYRAFVGKELAAAFAVQLDPSESDLRQMDRGELESLSKAPAPGAKNSEARMTITREFWTALIWITLLIALVEGGLAHRFSQAK